MLRNQPVADFSGEPAPLKRGASLQGAMWWRGNVSYCNSVDGLCPRGFFNPVSVVYFFVLLRFKGLIFINGGMVSPNKNPQWF